MIINLDYPVNFGIDYFMNCLNEMKKGKKFRFESQLFIFIIFEIRESLVDFFGIVKDRPIRIGIQFLLINVIVSD